MNIFQKFIIKLFFIDQKHKIIITNIRIINFISQLIGTLNHLILIKAQTIFILKLINFEANKLDILIDTL
jgi:hypothetical protein